MTHYHSDPTRETEPYALPNVEIEFFEKGELWQTGEEFEDDNPAGFYYAFGFPGCLPDSDWLGPFATENEALQDAQQQ